jgi:PAS domain-containing protein
MGFPLPDHGTRDSPADHAPTDALVVWTDSEGVILEASAGAAALLGFSHHGLIGRAMYLFVTANRARVLRAVEQAGRGHDNTLDVELHPRGRRIVRVRMHLGFVTQLDWGSVVRWVLHPLNSATRD